MHWGGLVIESSHDRSKAKCGCAQTTGTDTPNTTLR